MSAFKRTPRPWRVFDDGKYVKVVGADSTCLFFENVANPGAREDAHLISAAPDLLEAATAARDALVVAIKAAWGGVDADVSEHIVIKKIDAAIAKATGGAA